MDCDGEVSWQREQRRVAVLLDLGIAPLAACVSAPGARPCHRVTRPDPGMSPPATAEVSSARGASDSEPEQPSAKTVVSTPARPLKRPAGSKPFDDITDVDSQPAARDTTADAGRRSAGENTSNSVAFQLLIASAGDWLWLEQLEDALIRREQLQLVQGMARCISEGDLAMTHLQFDWPLASHAHLPRDAAAARESVAGQLRRLARERQARGVVLMGAACRAWVHVPPALRCLEIPATLAMLTTPALKRDAWGVLQPHSR